MFSSNCCFLTCIQTSQEAGQVVWYSHLFKNFPQFVMIHTVKGFSIVNEADVFLEFSYFFYDPTDVGNLISSSSAISKSSLNIWKFLLACEMSAIVWQFFSCFSSTFAYWVKLVSSFLKQVGLENSKNSLLWMVLQTLTASQATYCRGLSPVKLFFRIVFKNKMKIYYHHFPP